MNENSLRAMLEPIRRRVLMAFGRAVVRAVNDDLNRQLLQIEVLKGELRDKVERMQNYGFTSVPLPGADAAVAFVGGDRGHGIVLVVDDRRYRLSGLEAGEVAIYTDEGDKIHLKRGREIHMTAGVKVVIDAPDVEMTGTLTVTGDVIADGISLTTHVHSGVTTGGGVTGVPQ